MIALIEALLYSGMSAFDAGINRSAARRRGPVHQVRVVRASEAHRLTNLLRAEMEKTGRLERRNRELEAMTAGLQSEIDAARRILARHHIA